MKASIFGYRPILGILTLVFLLQSCTPEREGLESIQSTPVSLIYDASQQGNSSFHFLTPIIKSPSFNGIFDNSVEPLVEIIPLDEMNSYPIVQWTLGNGLDLDTSAEMFKVNWKLKDYNLDLSVIYRVQVSVENIIVGFADVHLVENGKELKNVNTNEFIPLVDGRTLPIKFRIEQGILENNDFDMDGFINLYDCDDTNPNINPESMEVCNNSVDDNCDGQIDEDCVQLPDPLAYYSFTGSAIDETGNGNNGTIIGATFATDRFEIANSALSFDGINDEVQISLTEELKSYTAGSHTISLWITRSSLSGIKFVLDAAFPFTPTGDQRGIRFESSELPTFKWVTTTNSFRTVASDPILANNEWFHVVGVFDETTGIGKIYINGIESSSNTSSGAATSINVLKIGNISAGGTGNGYYHGKIDDVRIYGEALSFDQIQLLFMEQESI